MNHFELSKRIIPCRINKEILLRIEKYLIAKVPQIFNLESKEVIDNFTVEIRDKFGSETFKSITHYDFDFFRNSTREISINLSFYKIPLKTFKIVFSRNFEDPEIRISTESDTAREQAITIYNGVIDILRENRNFVKYIKFAINPYTGGLFLTPLYYLFKAATIKGDWVDIILSLILTIYSLSFTFLGNIIFPFCEFKTKFQQNFKKVNAFLILGIVTFVLFDILFPLLRMRYLKF
jgi:hypothetical protein